MPFPCLFLECRIRMCALIRCFPLPAQLPAPLHPRSAHRPNPRRASRTLSSPPRAPLGSPPDPPSDPRCASRSATPPDSRSTPRPAPPMGKSTPRIFGKCAPNEKTNLSMGSGPCSVSSSQPTSILERNRMGIFQIHRGAEFLKMSEAKMQDCSSKKQWSSGR